jgi:hypothetical protein
VNTFESELVRLPVTDARAMRVENVTDDRSLRFDRVIDDIIRLARGTVFRIAAVANVCFASMRILLDRAVARGRREVPAPRARCPVPGRAEK